MTKYQKYTWICPSDCDALIEYTFKDGYGWPSGVMDLTCRCGSNCILLSVQDATIPTTNQTKEEKMEETTLSPAVDYNPDLLVTYKILNGYTDPEYATDKVRNIEWDLHNARAHSKTINGLNNKIGVVSDIITEAYADSDDQDTLRAIAEALDIPLVRYIDWSATIEVSGTIEVDLTDDYDVDSMIYDNLTVESQSGSVNVEDAEVTNVREN